MIIILQIHGLICCKPCQLNGKKRQKVDHETKREDIKRKTTKRNGKIAGLGEQKRLSCESWTKELET